MSHGDAMTYMLLAIVGFIWCSIIYVSIQICAKKYPTLKSNKILLVAYFIIAFAPPLSEVKHYYDFQKYCDANAGYRIINPVKTDSLAIRVDHYKIQDALQYPKINSVRIVYEDRFITRYKSPEYLIRIPQRKGKLSKRYKDLASRFYFDDRLTEALLKQQSEWVVSSGKFSPKFLFKISVPAGIYNEDYRESVNYTVLVMSLTDLETGKILTEYKEITTDAGVFMNNLIGSYWGRYSCHEAEVPLFIRNEYRYKDVYDFLDKALL